jgi:hypothetical protein
MEPDVTTTPQTTDLPDEPPVLLFTDSAAVKVGELIREEGNPNLKLRVLSRAAAAPGSSTDLPSTRTRRRATPASRTRASSC